MAGAATKKNAAPARAAKPPAVCTVEDCSRKPIARGLCGCHYRHWAILNPNVRQATTIPAIVESHLPGTQEKLIEATGYSSETVRRALTLLRREERAHIGDYQPPGRVGTRFMPIFHKGPGEDAKVTSQMRHEQKNRTARNAHSRRRIKQEVTTLPPSAGWAAALLIRPDLSWKKNPMRLKAAHQETEGGNAD
jgi:hypothetical protein